MSDNYIYYNRNPDGEHTEDCVTRAISTTTGLHYYAVANLLELTAYLNNCPKLCICCYHKLLEDILCYIPNVCINNETVEQIAKSLPHNKVIIRMEGHLTCSINGKIADIFDCGERTVDCYWVIK